MINSDDTAEIISSEKSNKIINENNGMYFIDGNRRIDFVLVYQRLKDSSDNMLKRKGFLNTLKKENLEIEIQDEFGHQHEIEDIGLLYTVDRPSQGTTKYSNIIDDRCAHCNLIFIKIHATWDTLSRYAEIMKIRKSMLNLGIEYDFNRKTFLQRIFEKFDFLNIFNINTKRMQSIPRGFTWPFSSAKEYLFDIPEDRSTIFTPGERSLIVNYILGRASYRRIFDQKKLNIADIATLNADIEMNIIDQESIDKIENINDMPLTPEDELYNAKIGMDYGIAKLLNEGVFESAYPLHEPIKGYCNDGMDTERNLLYKHWVSMGNVFRLQPIDHIRLYFGEKIAFYFAWLGYYTYWLLPISIFGIMVTIYNIMMTVNDVVVKEVCSGNNITMCPLICTSKSCKFWKLSDACNRFYVISILDNGATVILSIVMSLWASIFLEMWKRQQSRLAYQWNVHDMEYEDEPPRPEFVALIDNNYPRKINPVSGKEEPYIPFWRKRVPVTFFSCSTVILSIAMALSLLVGITLYKLVTTALLRMTGNDTLTNMSGVITSATGSVISLITIMCLTSVYSKVAVWLTDIEHHRTQSQYDNSVTLKLYILEFINNYSSIFYIGFIQPYTQQFPGLQNQSILKPIGCPAGGCLVELCVQLSFIMIGKQIISHIKEYSVPRLCSSLKAFQLKQAGNKIALINGTNNDEALTVKCSMTHDKDTTEITVFQELIKTPEIRTINDELVRCYADNILADPGPRPLFSEYLEMLIQFGFMTIFIPAFPLAPLLALINNLLEIRSDALKFVRALRRPVAQRTMNIGVWATILSIVTRIAVKSNAILIAFATSYIERSLYMLWYSNNGSLDGYSSFSLSYMRTNEFNVTSFKGKSGNHGMNETLCRYHGFRYPPFDTVNEPYTFSKAYWQILAMKILFVYIFENVVYLFITIISILIPDIPLRLRIAMKREAVLTNEIILKAELSRNKHVGASKIVAESFKRTVNAKKMWKNLRFTISAV